MTDSSDTASRPLLPSYWNGSFHTGKKELHYFTIRGKCLNSQDLSFTLSLKLITHLFECGWLHSSRSSIFSVILQ